MALALLVAAGGRFLYGSVHPAGREITTIDRVTDTHGEYIVLRSEENQTADPLDAATGC